MSEPGSGAKASKRFDPLEKDYLSIERIEGAAGAVGWASIASFCAYVWFHIHHDAWEPTAKFVFVSTAVVVICILLYLRYGAQPDLDRERLAMLLSDAFAVPYSPHSSAGYYTALAAPSLHRLLLNLAENTYFYPRLLRRDIITPAIVVTLMTAGLIVALRFGTAEVVELFAVVLLFSDLGLPRLLRMLWMVREYRLLHVECMRALGFGLPHDAPVEVEAMRLLAQYESVKSRGGVRAHDHTFHSMNDRLAAEWDVIRRRIPVPGQPAARR